jgi:hypothetical protein
VGGLVWRVGVVLKGGRARGRVFWRRGGRGWYPGGRVRGLLVGRVRDS